MSNGRPKKLAVNPIKSRIRDLERQLGRVDNKLPANVRVNHERELAALRSRLVDTEKEKRRGKMVERYHMVRFFERKKAEKNLKRLERKLRESGEGELEEVQGMVERARVDLNYTMFSPLVWRYCALWPKEKKGRGGDAPTAEGMDKIEEQKQGTSGEKGEDSALHGDPAMWERVKKATEEGQKALERLRDATDWRDPADGEVIKKRQQTKLNYKRDGEGTPAMKDEYPKKKARPKSDSKQSFSKQGEGANSDAESDGGFFE